MASKYRTRWNDSTAGKDGKPESSTMEIRINDLNAGNLAAQQALLATLLDAADDLTIALLAHETVILTDTFSSAGFAASKLAQRENKWLTTMEDNTTHRVEVFTLPGADLTLLSDNHSELLDLSAGVGLAWKNAVEAVYRSISGNQCTMVSVKYVGRNS